ncbi:malto-oligosyltrehalose synthase [Kineosporia sp. NBRC 101731]|uniref:malto-oligosyltrehalose synthase n=1 Tax=Kineosporia sp. NBRC 101731 TaxID=3032199 RepID=UPI0024A5CC84|nr:malto-oligosyltrehalose synthase [Kineosporia sp. NBRC 101731]GLY30341.1 malto-oligosyltrehalose synthase [Kineosporia sp. NBRC 101731]
MSVPVSTYRFQVRDSFGFADVGDRAAYLERLGVTHAYLSPILRATPGSAHGYDVVSHAELSEDAGGRPAFDAMVASLRAAGLAAVADVVPNHMAVPTPARLNAPYWSLLQHGPESEFASWFDVNWAPGRIIVPVLGDRLPKVLAAGEIAVDGSVVRYFDHEFPIRPGTENLPLEELLEAQWYRLAFWRTADEELNYRRFFDVTTLIAVRVEDRSVFDATHELIASLIKDGSLAGLRIDHPDGLADPRGYLRDLAEATDGAWVVVEKILEGEETLPSDWPCAGTTGYDALNRIGGLFVDPAGAAPLSDLLTEFTGDERTLEEIVGASKRQITDSSLNTEVRRLVDLLEEICDADRDLADFTRRGLHAAVVELLVAMDRYRAYVVPGEAAPAEAVATVDRAYAIAAQRVAPELVPALDLVKDLLLEGVAAGSDPVRAELVARFQQTCGPVMAKGIEDTTFYRYHRLIALNEVGGEPAHFGVSTDEFHAFSARLARDWPGTMTTLSTHDTKRSEDARATLAPLSEIPAEWAQAVREWSASAAKYRSSGGYPDASTEYLFWQTLLAVPGISPERLTDYLSKATREAKQLTTWTSPNTEFDEAVAAYARSVLADTSILEAVARFSARTAPAVRATVLGQKLVQLTMPGVPDVYQGTEVVDHSLVDPDNRRPIDYTYRERLLDLVESGSLGRLTGEELADAEKLLVTRAALHLRREHPDWFTGGSYTPIPTSSSHAVAFGRGPDATVKAVTVATRLALSLGEWGDAVVVLPEGTWTNKLTGQEFPGGSVKLAELLGTYPVALLTTP